MASRPKVASVGDGPIHDGLAAQRGLQVPHMFLCLLEQRTQGLGHVGQPEVHSLAEPMPVTLELALLETEVSSQRLTARRSSPPLAPR